MSRKHCQVFYIKSYKYLVRFEATSCMSIWCRILWTLESIWRSRGNENKFSLANVSMSFTKFRVALLQRIPSRAFAPTRRGASRRDAVRRRPRGLGAATQGLQDTNIGWTWTWQESGRDEEKERDREWRQRRESQRGEDAGRRGAACRTQQSVCSSWTGKTYTWRRQHRRRASFTLLLGALHTPFSSNRRTDAHRPTTPGVPFVRRFVRDAARPRNPETFERVKVALRRRVATSDSRGNRAGSLRGNRDAKSNWWLRGSF